MEKYLRNIRNLDMEIADEPEYSAFCSCAISHISEHSTDTEYYNELHWCIKHSKNLQICYRVAAHHSTSVPLCYLVRDFESETESVLYYLSFHEYSHRFPIDIETECPSMYVFLRKHPEYALEYLAREDRHLLHRQLAIMTRCGIYANLDYYSVFLASECKFTASKVRDALNSLDEGYELPGSLNSGQLLNKISIFNFLTFGLQFCANEELKMLIKSSDAPSIILLIRKMFKNPVLIVDEHRFLSEPLHGISGSICEKPAKKSLVNQPSVSVLDFDHLFGYKKCYKQLTDCPEL